MSPEQTHQPEDQEQIRRDAVEAAVDRLFHIDVRSGDFHYLPNEGRTLAEAIHAIVDRKHEDTVHALADDIVHREMHDGEAVWLSKDQIDQLITAITESDMIVRGSDDDIEETEDNEAIEKHAA